MSGFGVLPGSTGPMMSSNFVAVAVNLKYPCLLRKAGDDFVTVLSAGVHVTGPLYPSLNVISFSCGKSLSLNTVSGLTYVFPVVFIVFTPVDAKNLTSILSLGRSSSFGEVGSVGSTVTMWSLTINIWFGTSIEEPSVNATFNFPSNFPEFAELLFDKSVTVALAKSEFTTAASSVLVIAGATPSAQSILSPFQTLIVTGLSPPSSFTCSAIAFSVTIGFSVNVISVGLSPFSSTFTSGL